MNNNQWRIEFARNQMNPVAFTDLIEKPPKQLAICGEWITRTQKSSSNTNRTIYKRPKSQFKCVLFCALAMLWCRLLIRSGAGWFEHDRIICMFCCTGRGKCRNNWPRHYVELYRAYCGGCFFLNVCNYQGYVMCKLELVAIHYPIYVYTWCTSIDEKFNSIMWGGIVNLIIPTKDI